MVRLAMPGDSPRVARMLFDFNTEYEIETPPVDVLEPRVRGMLAAGWSRVLIAEVTGEAAGAIAGPGEPAGLGLVNFRRTVWSEGPAARLEELYVVPGRRGEGISRALLGAVIDLAREAGAPWLELDTGQYDTAARALYESAGFTNIENDKSHGQMLYYELEL